MQLRLIILFINVVISGEYYMASVCRMDRRMCYDHATHETPVPQHRPYIPHNFVLVLNWHTFDNAHRRMKA